jgi:hypothetical protein
MVRLTLFFLLIAPTVFAQNIMEGELVDNGTGKPIPFASIGVVGTSKGTSTNADGKFSLAVNGDELLRITCIGYESLEIGCASAKRIQLKPLLTQLNTVYVFSREVNPKKVIKKAFASITDNYNTQPFLQKFFYRHYCKDNFVYGRLLEAFVEVGKLNGYKNFQKEANDKESIRVTQLRRSLDNTVMAQGHEPISVGYAMQADLVGYQTAKKSTHVSFFTDVSNLKTDMDGYSFSFNGVTNYDGQDVFEINYQYKNDSAQTTSGYLKLVDISGTLFITTNTYAILKAEEIKSFEGSSVKTSAYYRKYDGKYYPYHFVKEGENITSDNSSHSFHVELMSVEIENERSVKPLEKKQTKADLLTIKYDSVFWNSHSQLKTTPLEDAIILDLGGGISLKKQFELYHQYENNTTDGGTLGEQKFAWYKEYNKGKKAMFVTLIASNGNNFLGELEYVKRLNRKYRGKVACIIISTEKDEIVWKNTLSKYNLFADGILNYRIAENAQLINLFQVKEIPAFVLITKDGQLLVDTKRPTDPTLEDDFKFLLAGSK